MIEILVHFFAISKTVIEFSADGHTSTLLSCLSDSDKAKR